MAKSPFCIKTNWTIGYVTNIEDSVTVEHIKDATQAKGSNIDDFTGAHRAMLLTKSAKKEEQEELCHIKIQSKPKYSIPMMTLISDCSKIELFTGTSEEYLKIVYGELLDEFEGIKSYIFEFYFSKKMIDDMLLKFVTNEERIWIYGIHMYLVEIPQNIFHPSIDIDNVQNMLSESNYNISENAEKCKEFIKMHMNSSQNISGPPTITSLMSFVNSKMYKLTKQASEPESKTAKESSDEDIAGFAVANDNSTNINWMKIYIDTKIKELENSILRKIDERFNSIERTQNKQFELILRLLNEKKNTE